MRMAVTVSDLPSAACGGVLITSDSGGWNAEDCEWICFNLLMFAGCV